VALVWLDSFYVLTCPSLCHLQFVELPYKLLRVILPSQVEPPELPFRDENPNRQNVIFDNLRSFNSNPSLSISSDDTHHTMIVTILILERASLFYASPSRPTLENALDLACSQYRSSDTHNAVKEQFPLPPTQYSISQFTEFIFGHRLR